MLSICSTMSRSILDTMPSRRGLQIPDADPICIFGFICTAAFTMSVARAAIPSRYLVTLVALLILLEVYLR